MIEPAAAHRIFAGVTGWAPSVEQCDQNWEAMNRGLPPPAGDLGNGFMTAMALAAGGALYAATRQGVYRLDLDPNE